MNGRTQRKQTSVEQISDYMSVQTAEHWTLLDVNVLSGDPSKQQAQQSAAQRSLQARSFTTRTLRAGCATLRKEYQAIVLVGLILCGCGSVSEKPPDVTRSDAITDSASTRCDVTKPFEAPTPIDGVNTNLHDLHGWLSTDQLTIYFSRVEGADRNLYSGTRAQPTGSFTNVTPISSVNTTALEERPVLTADGRTMFMEVNVGDIHVATVTRRPC